MRQEETGDSGAYLGSHTPELRPVQAGVTIVPLVALSQWTQLRVNGTPPNPNPLPVWFLKP